MSSPKRKRHFWSEDESEALKKSVSRYGHKWSTIIKNEPIFAKNGRSQVDLKDRWRNIQSKDGKLNLKSPVRKRSKSRSRSPRRKSRSPHTDFTIYTISGCGYCSDVRDIITKLGKKYKEVKVTSKNKDVVYKKTDPLTKKYRYFPMIFKSGKFIGGYTELKKMYA